MMQGVVILLHSCIRGRLVGVVLALVSDQKRFATFPEGHRMHVFFNVARAWI